MKKLFITLLMVDLCAGCATSGPSNEQRVEAERSQLEESLTSWNGADVNKLITQLGAPSSTYVMPNGNVIYTYDNSMSLPGFGGYNFPYICIKNYIVDKSTGLIVGHGYKGCVY